MIRFFLRSSISAFTIVGSVIGAGFITGREISVFFAKDFSVATLYLTWLCFTLVFYLIMSFPFGKISKKSLSIFISLANVFISGCMFSALEKIYAQMFINTKNVLFFSIITAILIFYISSRGIEGIGKFNLLLIPIVIFVVAFFGLQRIETKVVCVSPKTINGLINPLIYVGFNSILSFTVIKNSGENLSPPFKLLSSIITALILCALILVISLAIKSLTSESEMPFINLFDKDVKLLKIIDIITLFAILTTYVSSLYTTFDFGRANLKFRHKIILFLITLSVSNIGFSKIVDAVYPVIGVVGFILLLIICLLSKIFQAEKPKRTLRPLKRKG